MKFTQSLHLRILRWFAGLAATALVLTLMVDGSPFALAAGGGSAVKGPTAKAPVAAGTTQRLAVPDTSVPLAKQFCLAIQDQAAEARYAWQMAQLEQLAKQVDAQIEKLDRHSAALSEWMAKRDSFSKQATDHLVAIFSGMRPEAASEQFVRLNPSAAAAILNKLEQRAASAILNEIPADKAARITSILADAARKSDRDGTK